MVARLSAADTLEETMAAAHEVLAELAVAEHQDQATTPSRSPR